MKIGDKVSVIHGMYTGLDGEVSDIIRSTHDASDPDPLYIVFIGSHSWSVGAYWKDELRAIE